MAKFIKIEKRLGIVLACIITIIENDKQEVRVVIENYKRTIKRFNNEKILIGTSDLIDELTEVIEEALW